MAKQTPGSGRLKGRFIELLKQRGYSGVTDFCQRLKISVPLVYGVINGMTGGPGSNGELIQQILVASIGQKELEELQKANRLVNSKQRRIKEKSRTLVGPFRLALCAAGMTRRQFRETHDTDYETLEACLHGRYSGVTPEVGRVMEIIKQTIEQYEADRPGPASLFWFLKTEAIRSGKKLRAIAREHGLDPVEVGNIEAGQKVSPLAVCRYNTAAARLGLPTVATKPAETLLDLIHDHGYQTSVMARMLGCSRETVGQLCQKKLSSASRFAPGLVMLTAGLTGRPETEIENFLLAAIVPARPATPAEREYAAAARDHYQTWQATDRELREKLQTLGYTSLADFGKKHQLSATPVLAALCTGGSQLKSAAKAHKLLVKILGAEFVKHIQTGRQPYPHREELLVTSRAVKCIYPQPSPYLKSRQRKEQLLSRHAS